MRSRYLRLAYVSAVTAVGLCGCERPQSDSLRPATQLGPLNGQVFVVTRGSENVRLGELIVFITSLRHFRDLHVDEVAQQKMRDFAREFTNAKRVGGAREALVRDIKANYATLVQERDRLVAALPASSILHERYVRLRSEIKKRDEQLDQFAMDLRSLGNDSYRECTEISAAVSELPQATANFAYEKLVPGSESCKTDADGKFHFEYAVSEEMVVFTRGHRELPSGTTEKYQWFVYARSVRDPSRQVLLTNNNLVDGPAPENLFSSAVRMARTAGFVVPRSEDREVARRAPIPHEPRWSKTGIFYLLRYVSVSTADSVIGLPPGTQLRQVARKDDRVLGRCGDIDCEVRIALLTDNVDLATEVQNSDYDAQTQIAQWQAQQIQIEHSLTDEENRRRDEVQRRIEADYHQMHSLTGESRLNEPAHQ
jgi:hypothetical protein